MVLPSISLFLAFLTRGRGGGVGGGGLSGGTPLKVEYYLKFTMGVCR